jgi:transketolase
MAMDPFRDKWAAFGWDAHDVNGHDVGAVTELLRNISPGKPTAIIAHTTKGKGVSFMQDDNNWHYRIPKPEEVEAARKELGLA